MATVRPADAAGPLYISQATRHGGVVTLEILNHALVATDVNRQITVAGVSIPSINGTFTISQVIPPHNLRYKQSASLPDVDLGVVGGAVSLNT